MSKELKLVVTPERLVELVAQHRLVANTTPNWSEAVLCRCGMHFLRVEQYDRHVAEMIVAEGQS